jgi:hypothetical protein
VINPLRSEDEAFRFTLIVAVLIAPVALAAIFVSSTAAVVVGGGVIVGLVVGLFLLKRREPEEKLLLGSEPADNTFRILVIANETLRGQALRAEIEHRIRERHAAVRVVCPALNTKIKHWVSDEDGARQEARKRVDSVIAQLARDGVSAEGDIGDSDPVQAMEDALRLFPADEAIISTHPYGRSNWLERDVVSRARERFPLPITHVVVDLEHEQEFVAKGES